jgi:hypothetical protein
MSEFSLEGYYKLLSTFKDAGYLFCTFEEIDQRLTKEDPFVVLRHDIDISLRPALEIAHIENEQNVRSTYFISLHSPFYNTLSLASSKIIKKIHALGHQIALHVDTMAYEGNLTHALQEIEVFSRFYPYANVRIASLHSPIDLEHIPMEPFDQLLQVYGHMLNKKMAYISDSTGRWRYGHPLTSETFYLRRPIQLLTHPVWWVQSDETPTKKIESRLYKDYLNTIMEAEEFLPKLFKSHQSS